MDIEALRAQTPGCAHRTHLNNAGAALMAQPTLEAMGAHLRLEAEIGGYEAEVAHDAIVDTYRALAELLGARSEEIAFFDNATHAWNAAFYSVPSAGEIASSPGARSTAATCWPTSRWRGGSGWRWSSFPTTSMGRSMSPRSRAWWMSEPG